MCLTVDAYTEQIIKKKKGAKEWALMLASLVVSILFLWALSPLMAIPMLFMIAVAGAGWLMWYVIGSQNIEFEYCVTNGDIDVDQIVGQRKRKRIVSVRGKKLQAIAPYTAGCLDGKKVDRFVMAAPSEHEPDNWYFTYTSKKSGFTAVVFQPNEKVLRLIYKGLPRLAQLDMEKAGYQPTADEEE